LIPVAQRCCYACCLQKVEANKERKRKRKRKREKERERERESQHNACQSSVYKW